MNTSNVNQVKYVNPAFKSVQAKTETISSQTKIIYDTKPDEFVKQEGMSTKAKIAISASILAVIALGILALTKGRGAKIEQNLADMATETTKKGVQKADTTGSLPGSIKPQHIKQSIKNTNTSLITQNIVKLTPEEFSKLLSEDVEKIDVKNLIEILKKSDIKELPKNIDYNQSKGICLFNGKPLNGLFTQEEKGKRSIELYKNGINTDNITISSNKMILEQGENLSTYKGNYKTVTFNLTDGYSHKIQLGLDKSTPEGKKYLEEAMDIYNKMLKGNTDNNGDFSYIIKGDLSKPGQKRIIKLKDNREVAWYDYSQFVNNGILEKPSVKITYFPKDGSSLTYITFHTS